MKNDTSTVTIPKEEYTAMKEQISELSQKVEWFMEQIRLSQHRRFGSSSEKTIQGAEQLNLFNETEVTADVNFSEPELVEIENHYRKRKRAASDRFPDDLPVEIIEHDLPDEEKICEECSCSLHVMGKETRRELVFVPAQAKIREHVRKVYSCRNCETDECGVPIRKAPIDEPVIKGSFAAPEAIAHIITQKFVMASPLYRLEQEFKRNGIHLSRQTMSNWLLRSTEDWLEPIYNALHEILLMRDVIHADETTLQVLREPGKVAQSKSYMWLYRTSGDTQSPIVLYEYQPDRRAKRPEEFLNGYKGYIHADGYDGYHSLSEGMVVVGCWTHARRKWEEALKCLPPGDRKNASAQRGKRYCDKLFDIERKLEDLKPEERFIKRQELAKPIVDEMFAWLKSVNTPPKTHYGRAVNYTLGQRKYLERYLLDGRLEISNNRAERSIKPFVIGRKNFLFANTPRGAKASAIMYSMVETAKENGLNPYAYLTYIFKNAPNWDIKNNLNMYEFLLPWGVPDYCKAGHQAHF